MKCPRCGKRLYTGGSSDGPENSTIRQKICQIKRGGCGYSTVTYERGPRVDDKAQQRRLWQQE